nr:glycogen debranching protein GlgX [Oleiagrimonas sp. C23AA]
MTGGLGDSVRPGVEPLDDGLRFGVVSRHAERIELCLFDAQSGRETARLPMPEREGDLWYGYLADAGPGLLYGYRAYGPYQPGRGHRFNPHKLLIDPHATALEGRFVWNPAVFGYQDRHCNDADAIDSRDSAPFVPRCRVSPFSAEPSRTPRPGVPWADTVIYELHARGYTMRHPQVPTPLRGKLEALALPVVTDYLRGLGITTLELLPLAAFIDEQRLVSQGLRNYWGYNPLAPLALHAPYLAGTGPASFAAVLDRLHEAGLELIVDVVFNHTAESDAYGPTLTLRGLDNALYYRLDPDHPESYVNYSGCGNTLDLSQPAVLEWVLAALRYWARLGVDGFRLDLASALMRDRSGRFQTHAPLFDAIGKDELLRPLKWIAEPWDLGPGGQALGRFPAPVAQWNDRFRDSARRFWRGDPHTTGEWATRLSGSADLFAMARTPLAGINLITSHDGFTLADLTAYQHKHNWANGEQNRDGHEPNWSSHGGVEGDTADPGIGILRRRRRRALLGSVLLARGVPMLLAGDELSHTQDGNNNAYCQDNRLTWIDWSARGDTRRDLRGFVTRALSLRRRFAALHGSGFFTGQIDDSGARDILWLRTDGRPFSRQDWDRHADMALMALICDKQASDAAESWIWLIMQPGTDTRAVQVPPSPGGGAWVCVLDSTRETVADEFPVYVTGQSMVLPGIALRVLVSPACRL